MPDQRHPRPAPAEFLIGGEHPAQHGTDAQYVGEIVRDPLAGDPVASVVGREREFAAAKRRHGAERLVVLPPRFKIAVVDARVLQVPLGRRFVEVDELFRVGEGQRPDEQGVHHAEDGRVAGDAEREDQDRHDGEAGRFCELAKGVTEVVHGS